MVEEKMSVSSYLAIFFKQAARQDSNITDLFFQTTGIDRRSAGDYHLSTTEQSLRDRWVNYVNSIRNNESEENRESKFNQFFKNKDSKLLLECQMEYQRWFAGAERNFKAAKIFKDYGLRQSEYNLYLTLDPQNDDNYLPNITITGRDIHLPNAEHYKYYLKKLDAHDPRAACLGKITNCCQSLDLDDNEVGTLLTTCGIENPRGGFYVICKMKRATPDAADPIVSQTLALRLYDAVLFNALVPLSKVGDGIVNVSEGISCKNIDIWIALYQELARRLVGLGPYAGLNAVSLVMAGLEYHTPVNLGLHTKTYHLGTPGDLVPPRFRVSRELDDDDQPIGEAPPPFDTQHQVILASRHFPLHAIYMLSHNCHTFLQGSQGESARKIAQEEIYNYINDSQNGFETIYKLIANSYIESAEYFVRARIHGRESVCVLGVHHIIFDIMNLYKNTNPEFLEKTQKLLQLVNTIGTEPEYQQILIEIGTLAPLSHMIWFFKQYCNTTNKNVQFVINETCKKERWDIMVHLLAVKNWDEEKSHFGENTVKGIISKDKAKLAFRVRNANGETAFMVAVQHKNWNMVRLFIRFIADVYENSKDHYQNTPMMWLASRENPEDLRALALILRQQYSECGKKLDMEERNVTGSTALMIAIQNKRWDVAKTLLLDLDANINTTDKNQYTPLMWLARNGNQDDIHALIQILEQTKTIQKLNLEARDAEGNIACTLAAKHNPSNIVALGRLYGAEISKKYVSKGINLFMCTGTEEPPKVQTTPPVSIATISIFEAPESKSMATLKKPAPQELSPTDHVLQLISNIKDKIKQNISMQTIAGRQGAFAKILDLLTDCEIEFNSQERQVIQQQLDELETASQSLSGADKKLVADKIKVYRLLIIPFTESEIASLT